MRLVSPPFISKRIPRYSTVRAFSKSFSKPTWVSTKWQMKTSINYQPSPTALTSRIHPLKFTLNPWWIFSQSCIFKSIMFSLNANAFDSQKIARIDFTRAPNQNSLPVSYCQRKEDGNYPTPPPWLPQTQLLAIGERENWFTRCYSPCTIILILTSSLPGHIYPYVIRCKFPNLFVDRVKVSMLQRKAVT